MWTLSLFAPGFPREFPTLKGRNALSPLLRLSFVIPHPKWLFMYRISPSTLSLPVCPCPHMSLCVCLSVTPSLPPSIYPSLHHFLSVWVSMQCDPGELITVDACNAGTKTLHRQHNSSSRNQSGSTQLYPTGPAPISPAQSQGLSGIKPP